MNFKATDESKERATAKKELKAACDGLIDQTHSCCDLFCKIVDKLFYAISKETDAVCDKIKTPIPPNTNIIQSVAESLNESENLNSALNDIQAMLNKVRASIKELEEKQSFYINKQKISFLFKC